jgi:alpha,alpha-trehalase
VATLEAVRAELARDGYVYRFRHDQRPLHEAEGAFTLCGFAMALAAAQRGKLPEAFVHAFMFECAARLGRRGEDDGV